MEEGTNGRKGRVEEGKSVGGDEWEEGTSGEDGWKEGRVEEGTSGEDEWKEETSRRRVRVEEG